MALVVFLSVLVALSDASFYQMWKDRLAEDSNPAGAGLRSFNMDLIIPEPRLHLQDLTGTETLEVQTAGDSLSDDLYKFLKLKEQDSKEDLKFKFTNQGIRGAVFQTYQHPIHTGVNITILWMGSNNIGSMDSHELASKILDAMRSYEEQGMICFVINMPARYSLRAKSNYLAESRKVNNILEQHLNHSGRYIRLPREAYVREAYSDLVHFTPEMYKIIAELVLTTIKEYIKTKSHSIPAWHPSYELLLLIMSLLLLFYIIKVCHQKSTKHIFVHLK